MEKRVGPAKSRQSEVPETDYFSAAVEFFKTRRQKGRIGHESPVQFNRALLLRIEIDIVWAAGSVSKGLHRAQRSAGHRPLIAEFGKKAIGGVHLAWRHQKIQVARLPQSDISVGLPGKNRALERHNLGSSLLHSSDDPSQFGNQEQTTLLIPDGGFMKSLADVWWYLPRLAQKRRERNGDTVFSGRR